MAFKDTVVITKLKNNNVVDITSSHELEEKRRLTYIMIDMLPYGWKPQNPDWEEIPDYQVENVYI